MHLSKRIETMQYSPIRKLSGFANEAEEKGIKVYHLNIGQPDVETPEEYFKGIQTFHDKVVKYTDSQGMNPLISSFIEYYKKWNVVFDKDEIMITNGGSEAVLFSLMAICDAGDEIIVPEPFYTNYNGFCQAIGVNIKPFLTKAEDGFHLPNKEVIVNNITSKTKAILISNPGNPTGVVYSYDEMKMLTDIALEHNIYLISDEVYREFVYEGFPYTSALYFSNVLDRIIVIDSVSKRYSACGARIGMIGSKNKELIHQILKLCQLRLCVPTVEQLAAANLVNTPKEYFDKVKKEYEKRRDIMFDGLSKIPGVICEKPRGAFYIIAKLPIHDAEHFAKWLLTDFSFKNKTVMVAPASGFYSSKNSGLNEIRLSYCINSDDLKDAMDVLKIALEKYKTLHD